MKARIRLIAAIVYVIGAIALVIYLAKRDSEHFAAQAAATPHVFLIMMENKEETSIMGNPSAPTINRLARRYGYATRFYGVTHPSLPNYVASIAGDFFNAYNDWQGNRFNSRNIVDQMETKGLTWKAYMESMPSPGFNGDTYPPGPLALYARKHNPFMMMNDVIHSKARRKRVVPATQLTKDLAHNTVPSFSYISPNLCNDMHGIDAPNSPCPPEPVNASIKRGDRYLAGLIPLIKHSKAWRDNSMIIITWDEGESLKGCCAGPGNDGGGRIPTIVIARRGVRHYVSHTPYNHYSILRTVQSIWDLGCLRHTCERKVVKPMTEFLHRKKR